MKPPDEAEMPDALSIALPVAVNVLYLAGIAAIELLLRPLLGGDGIPRLVDSILTAGDLALFFALSRRLVIALASLGRIVKHTSSADLAAELGRRTSQLMQSPSRLAATEPHAADESTGTPQAEEPDEVSAEEAIDGEQSDTET